MKSKMPQLNDGASDSFVGRSDTSVLSCRSGSLVNQSAVSYNKIDRLDIFEEKVLETLDLTEQFLDYLVCHGVLTQSDVADFVGLTSASKSDILRQNRAFLTLLKSRLLASLNGLDKQTSFTESQQVESEAPKTVSRQTSKRLDESDASSSASGYALFINALRYSGQLGLANLLDNEKRIESQFTRLLQTNAQPTASPEGSTDKRRYNGQVSLILQVSAICVNTTEYASWKLLETGDKDAKSNGSAGPEVSSTPRDNPNPAQQGTSWIHFSEPPAKDAAPNAVISNEARTQTSSKQANKRAKSAPAKRRGKTSEQKASGRKPKKASLLRRLFCGCASKTEEADDSGAETQTDSTARNESKAPTDIAAEVARARAATLLNEKSIEYYHLLCETYHTVLLRYFEQSLKVLVLRIAALPTRCALQIALIFTQRSTLEQFEALFASGALQTALEKRLLLDTNACVALKLRALRFTVELDRTEYAEALAELGD